MTSKEMCCQIRYRITAFSLVEVVVAVGIFALAIVAVIGLLAPLGSSVTDVRDGDDASRVATTIQSGLQDEVNRLKQQDSSSYWTTFASYLDGTTVLYANRDGSVVGKVDSLGPDGLSIWDTDKAGGVTPLEEFARFFEVTLSRNTALSSVATDASAGYLAFNITLRWPGYIRTGEDSVVQVYHPDPDTNASLKAQQSVLILPAAVVR
jgi:type II secretory pathway pseudopilin PulG